MAKGSTASSRAATRGAHRLNYGWILRLRWAAICGQTITILGVHFGFPLTLPLLPLGGIIAFEVVSNLFATWFARSSREIGELQIASLLLLDVACLTALLYFSGGPNNPFSFLYLIHAALAAVALSSRFTWVVVVAAISAMGALFWGHHGMGDHHHHGPEEMQMHVRGMWVACALGSVFIVYFIGRIRSSLEVARAALDGARIDAERARRVAALTTLAAGAAHELATPLATIAIAAKEMERQVEANTSHSALVEDAQLIRRETARCHAVLQRLSVAAGRQDPHEVYSIELADLVEDALDLVTANEGVVVEMPDALAHATVTGPLTALAQAIRALIVNAQQAGGEGSRVELSATRLEDRRLTLDIVDQGPTVPAEYRDRIGEPFFTTKGVGEGMGLGVFLARAVVEGIGGRLEYLANQETGMTARITFPDASQAMNSQ